METLLNAPWPWYIAGPLLGVAIPLLLFGGNKQLGASPALRHLCAMILPKKIPYFDYEVKKEIWNLLFAFGVLLGGALAGFFLNNPEPVQLSKATISDLNALGIYNFTGLMPAELFSHTQLQQVEGLVLTLLGGFLLGFGVRYANGCTSGHGFMGLSKANLGSLIAITAFFVGGIIMTHLLLSHLL